jgi:hypothetical protein
MRACRDVASKLARSLAASWCAHSTAKIRRQSIDSGELIYAYAASMDACARAFLATADMLDASVLTAPLAERYEGWASAGGRAILAGERSLADLADRSLAPGSDPQPRSGRQEYLESLGTIMHIEASFNHDRLRGIADDNWRVSERRGTPLAMTATGIHLTDLILDLIGPIETVTAFPATRTANTGYAETLSVHVDFASKATGYLSTVLATPFHARLAIFGMEAWAEVRDASHPDEAGPSTLTVQRRGRAPILTTLPGRDAIRSNLERFALSIDGEASNPFTVEQILGNIAVMDAVSRSIAIG